MDRLTAPLTGLDPMHNNWGYFGLELSAVQVISPPTSIRNKGGQTGVATFQPGGEFYRLPMGQFTFWSYFTGPGQVWIAFRIQDPPTIPIADQCYYLVYSSFAPTKAYRWDTPNLTLLGLFDYVPTPGLWEHLLVLWAPSCALDGTPAFEILLMKEGPWGWAGQGVAFDPEDAWYASDVNQFGFLIQTDNIPDHTYFDDTRLSEWDGYILHT